MIHSADHVIFNVVFIKMDVIIDLTENGDGLVDYVALAQSAI